MSSQIRILLLEDSEEDAELMVAELLAAGIALAWRRVQSGEELARALEEFRPDIVLSDFQLPGYDGRRALQLVRARSPETPVIMVTGAVGDELAVDLLKAGARDYVLKNRLPRLPLAVERALAEERERRGLRAAELALRESEQRFREVFHNSPDAIFVTEVTPEGAFLLGPANLAWERMTGLASAQVQGRSLEEVIPCDLVDSWLARCRRCVGEGATLTWEEQRFVEGLRHCYQSTLTPLPGEAGAIRRLLGVARDITERANIAAENARLLKQETEAREAAEAVARIKSEFLDVAAHELKTPVAATSLLIQTCQRQLDRGMPVSASSLVRLRGQTDRLAGLVDELLNVSRLERGAVGLRLAKVDLVALISEAIEHARARAPRRCISFDFPRRPLEAVLDPGRIGEVVTNIIDNALKYTPVESPIEVAVTAPPGSVQVSVTDHGPGIPRDQQGALFSRFYRANSEATLLHPGLGLGLFICRTLVELHGGEIGLRSVPGEGSTFYFDLPLEGAQRQREMPAEAPGLRH